MSVQRYVFRYHDATHGLYEKEGGWRTNELQEAKLIGWGSKRFVNPRNPRTDGELVPARIVIA